MKPPETSAVCAPFARMVRTSARPPGVSVMRSSITLATTSASRPLSSATRSRSAGSKAISPRMARSVIALDVLLHADEIGEFVDAFLPDHGGIHVGEEQLLAPAGLGLAHDVDGQAAEARCALPAQAGRAPPCRCWPRRKECRRPCRAPASAARRRGAGRRRRAPMTLESMPGPLSGAMRVAMQEITCDPRLSRRRSPGAGKELRRGARHSHCRTDRQRQVRSRHRHREGAGRRGRQRRFHAGLSRPADHHGPADAGGGGRRRAPPVRPCGRGGELFRRPVARGRQRRASPTFRRAGARPCWSAGPACISRR